MYQLIVGVGRVSLLMRHAQSLKDKRNVMKGIMQRLKNQGFSVTECGDCESVKTGTIGFSFAGSDRGVVQKALEAGLRLFVGEFELVGQDTEVFDYSGDDTPNISEDEDLKYGL